MSDGQGRVDREALLRVDDERSGRVDKARCAVMRHPLRVLTDDQGVPGQVVCWCGEQSFEVPRPDELRRLRELQRMVSDLDRCEHGRHRLDSCFDCPGGRSSGNRFMPAPGERVGTDLGGRPYFVPSGERPDPLCTTSDPQAWRRDGREG